MVIHSGQETDIKPFLDSFTLPSAGSHKGQNGRTLIIGGSSLFHSASIWAAEVASYFVDIVHYSSTVENNEVMTGLKEKWQGGIVVAQSDIPAYVEEDDAILVGPGMLRTKDQISHPKGGRPLGENNEFQKLLDIKDEGEYTYFLVKYLIENFPDKKFVFDAGALQMMEAGWLLKLKEKPIVTPHAVEFEKLFGISIADKSIEETKEIVSATAKKYSCVILLKTGFDIISDGELTHIVEGGNEGLTKGGTGDTLAGLTVALFTKHEAVTSSVLASFLIKTTADQLKKTYGYWYNVNTLISEVPKTLATFKLKK